MSALKHVVLADLRPENADAAAEILGNAGFEVSTATVDVSSRESVHTLVKPLRRSMTSPASSTPPASPPARQRREQSCLSICTAPRWCLRSSAMSSPQAVPAS